MLPAMLAPMGKPNALECGLGSGLFYTYDAEKTPQGAESSINAKGGINFRFGLGLALAWGLAVEASASDEMATTAD